MDYKEIYCGVVSTVKALASSAPAKLVASAAMAMFLHKHAILLYAFVLLVFLDCFTRWIAIGYDYLVKVDWAMQDIDGVPEEERVQLQPSFWDSVMAIKPARAAGLISSDVMKHRFLGKIAVYLICVIAAGTTDLVMSYLAKPIWAVECVVGYLVLTELLSIVENLNDAGIEMVKGLVEILKRRKEGIK